EVVVPGVGVVFVVGEGVIVADEVLDVAGGNGEAESLARRDAHVGAADDFAVEVEKRTAGVAGVDLGGGLDEGQALEVPLGGCDDTGAQRTLEAKRVADGKDFFTSREILGGLNRHIPEGATVGAGDLDQGEVDVVVDRDDLDIFDG